MRCDDLYPRTKTKRQGSPRRIRGSTSPMGYSVTHHTCVLPVLRPRHSLTGTQKILFRRRRLLPWRYPFRRYGSFLPLHSRDRGPGFRKIRCNPASGVTCNRTGTRLCGTPRVTYPSSTRTLPPSPSPSATSSVSTFVPLHCSFQKVVPRIFPPQSFSPILQQVEFE